MRESERRIKEYQEALPHIKEKVAAMLIMLVMSVIMMTSATFAWITLSKSPEVTGMATTVAANGNLEIALSNAEQTVPSESMVGDSKKEIVLRNQTWGNLVSLSDETYGLENIVLRPASLNSSALKSNPLFSAEYAQDGRIKDLTSDFAYSNYNPKTGTFSVPAITQYGVRAISSVTYTFEGGTEIYIERLKSAERRMMNAQNTYSGLITDSNNINAIAGIMGDFLTEKFDDGAVKNYSKYVPVIYDMMNKFNESMISASDAYLYLANLQMMLKLGDASKPYQSFDELMADSKNWIEKGVSLDGVEKLSTDRTDSAKYLQEITTLYENVTNNGVAVYWSDLEDCFGFLVDVDTTEVDGKAVKDIGMSEAAGMLSGTRTAVIKKGALVDMEDRLGVYMDVKNVKISATVFVSVTVKANVSTEALRTKKEYLPKLFAKMKESNGSNLVGTSPVAAETYGMAIDCWVRSNAENEYLVLEGTAIVKEYQKEDAQGRKYFTNSKGQAVLGITDGNGNITSYQLLDGTEYTLAEDETLTITYEEVVEGYEGVNRVWNDEQAKEELTINSVTQGGGSCYVFYANSPQEQEQSLEVLKAMTVVFVGINGELLAYADMDVEHYYAEMGRVTVPLVLRTSSLNVGTSDEPTYVITDLERGKAKFITALIYIDGTKITNNEVLSDADLQGQLNIQFGSTAEMQAIKDDDNYYKEVSISASATKTNFDGATETEFSTEITLNVSGITPEDVKASFIRKINNTQGTLQDSIKFETDSMSEDGGAYKAKVTFSTPGDYVLRRVWLDGVEYNLENPLTISISGFSVASLEWGHSSNYAKVLSAENQVAEDINVVFSGMVPKKVQGIFSNESLQQVTVDFKRGTTNWQGSATFVSSGVYTMQYLIIDGEYYEIPSSMWKTLDLSLGMNAQVAISETAWTYEEPKEVDVYVTVYDNAGNALSEMEDVWLLYMSQSSSLEENGLYTQLIWDAENQRYEGKFNVQFAGAYEFGYLLMNDSYIESADAPVITAIPPIPPSYGFDLTESTQFEFGTEVSMRIALYESNAIANNNVIAVMNKLDDNGQIIVDKDGNPVNILVSGLSKTHTADMDDNLTDWIFALPTTKSLQDAGYTFSQSGDWVISELRIIGAYDNGNISTEENPYIIDVSDKNIKTHISDEMQVVVNGDKESVIIGKDQNIKFLDAATVIDGLSVRVTGDGGQTANEVKNVKLKYVLTSGTISQSSISEGYAIAFENLKSYSEVVANLIPDPSDPNQFIIDVDAPLTLPLAGIYQLDSISYNIGNNTYIAKTTSSATNTDGMTVVEFSDSSVMPSYEFVWDSPIIKIDSINPSGEVIYNSGSTSNPTSAKGTNIKTDDYNCTVYIQADIVEDGKDCDGNTEYKVNSYTFPKVTTAISNINNFVSASINFKQENGDQSITFSYDKDNTKNTQNIGSEACNKIVLGKSKCSYVEINGTYGNGTEIKYVFALDTPVTINNPD